MDYAKHEKTYRLFLQLMKYTMAGASSPCRLVSAGDGCRARQPFRSAPA
ncbi:MAG: aa3-type cytochrome c oxidase subunit IV [Methylocella sp.]